MAKHTPAPWRIGDGHKTFFFDREGLRIGSTFETPHGDEVDRANAERITACVNACDGIPTEALKGTLLLVWIQIAAVEIRKRGGDKKIAEHLEKLYGLT